MNKPATEFINTARNFAVDHLDLACLVGQPVTVYSKQLPGRPIPTHVISTGSNQLRLASDGISNPLANLVTSQRVIIQIPYRGEWLSVSARLKKTDGGQCNFVFDGPVVPLSQRKYVRVLSAFPVTMTAFSQQTLQQRPLNKLSWFQTETRNFSSGGALIEVPGAIDQDLYVLLKIDTDLEDFPSMVLGQVRYCYANEAQQTLAGIEFVVKESAEKKYPTTTLKRLPEAVMSYTAPIREKINRIIQSGLRNEDRSYRS